MKLQIVLVLLLASSVFGFPGVRKKNSLQQKGRRLLDDVVKGLTNGADIQTAVMEKCKDHVVKIDKLMKDVEKKISEVTLEIGVINTEKSANLRDAHKTYRRIKSTLKDTRVELRRLAIQTQLKTSDLIHYMQSWDHEKYSSQQQKAYLKEQVVIVKKLLEESNVILGDAKSKYDQAYSDFETVNEKLELFRNKLDQMLDTESAAHEKWVYNTRLGIYSAAGGVSALLAMVGIFDALGCMGICSATAGVITWGVSIPMVEVKIAEVSQLIEELNVTVVNSIDSVKEINKHTKGIQEFIEIETNIIVKWHESVKHMNNYIDDATQDDFYRLRLKREIYEANLVKLKDAAKEFIDQPYNIYNDLDEALNDPTIKAQEKKERAALEVKGICGKNSKTKEDYEKCLKEVENASDD